MLLKKAAYLLGRLSTSSIFKPSHFFLIFGLFAYGISSAQNQTQKLMPNGVGYWEYLPPGYNTNTDKYPILFFFHGLGERGNGTTEMNRVLKNGPPEHIKNGYEFPFIVISPQLLSNYGNWPKRYMDDIVEYIKTQLRIDLDRIYISGLSLGGGGAWTYAQTFPEKVAALVPVCGSGNNTSLACDIVNEDIPVWAFHGDADGTVPFNKTVRMVNAINECIPAPDPLAILTLYPGVGHNCWDRAYRTDHQLHDPNVYEWLMQYSRSSITADAGPDKQIILPNNSINITGQGSATTAVTFQWVKSSGPSATLANTDNATLSVTNMVEGVYIFRLTVTDTNGETATDDVKVTVLQTNQPPTADAGPDKEIKLPTNSLTIFGSGSDDDGSISTYLWSKVSGGNATLSGNNSATLSLSNLEVGIYTFSLTVTDDDGATDSDEVKVTVLDADNLPPTANAGPDIDISLPTNSVNIVGNGSDNDGSISSHSWVKVSGPSATLTNANTATLSVTNLIEGTYKFRLTVTDDDGDTGSDDVTVNVSAANQNPTVIAGNDISITLPTTLASVSGAASDPDGSIVTYLWEQIDGPVTATIVNPSLAATTINNLTTAGIYNFSLTVTDDDGASASDELSIVVNAAPVNEAPIANAGADIFITLPTNSVTINGSGTDIDGTISSYSWTKLSGGTATLSAQNTKTLQVANLTAGDYEFRLTVTDDDGATATDNVKVIVSPEDVNESPVADAGIDQVLTLPLNATVLNGTGTDPDGSIVSYVWIKTAGPAATLANENTADLSLSNLIEGNYSFKLTVTDDDGAIDTDIVKVTVNAANTPPIVNAGSNQTITLPVNTIVLSGSVSDPDGSIATIIWSQVNGPSTATFSGEDTPTLTASGLVAGLYTFKLTATDNDGASAEDEVNVTVNEAVNQSPNASAGPDKNITLPTNSVNLTGTAIDNDGTIASIVWSQRSGPASATLSNINNLTVSITDLQEGTYIFQINITDDDGATDFDRATVVVNPAATNDPPTAEAGPNKNITLPVNSVILAGSGSDTDGTIVSYTWTKVSGPTSTLTNEATPTLTASGLLEGNYIFRLTVTDDDGATAFDQVSVTVQPAIVNQSPTANAGPDINLTLPTNMTTINGSGSDPEGAALTYEWAQLSGTAATLTNDNNATLTVSDLVAGAFTFELTVTDNQGAIDTDIVTIIVNPETVNQKPIANAGPDQSVTLPTNSLSLNGSGSDADGTITGYKWSKVSGPSVTMGNATVANLMLSDLIEGIYVFRLKVTDNESATDTDEVKITVIPASVNQPPTVNAGADKTIKLPVNSIVLNGLASDPDGSISSKVWTKVTGGNATISNTQTLSTFVSNLEEGSYTFRLTVTDDDDASEFDEVKITVLAADENFPPLANAGADLSIKLPANSIMVFGSGTDSDGTIVGYQWTKLSGPSVTVTDADASELLLSDMLVGTYTFRLTVEDDKGATATDEVKIDVLPASVNTPPVVSAGQDQLIQLPENSIDITGTASDDGTVISVQWTKVSGPDGFSITNDDTSTASLTNLGAGTYIFRFTATDNEGLSLSDDMKLTVLDEEVFGENLPPYVDAGEDQTLQVPENTTILQAFANDPDDIVQSFFWSQIDGPTDVVIEYPDSSTTSISGLVIGKYTLRVEVSDLSNATATDVINIIVLDEDEVARPHKLFSPNNDGIDDFWVIDNYEALSDCKTIIFNRQGEEVYEMSGYQNNWDGTTNGHQLPDGVYYYVIRCGGSDKNTLSGSVTIIR